MFGKKGILILLISLCIACAVQAANLIHGDSSEDNVTFSVPIKSFEFNDAWGVSCFGAAAQGAKNYALSIHKHGSTFCSPIAPEKIKINNAKDDVLNPLYDQEIASLTFVVHASDISEAYDKLQIAAYTPKTPSTIYMYDSLDNIEKMSLLSASEIKDATGQQVTGGVVGMVGGANYSIYAAVKNHAGEDFGAPASGIALLEHTMVTVKKTEDSIEQQPVLRQIDSLVAHKDDTKNLTRAVPLDGTLHGIKIGNDAKILDNAIDMHWDKSLNCLYIALHVEAGDQETDGACALVVGSVVCEAVPVEDEKEGKKLNKTQKLTLKRVFDNNAVFQGEQNKIVGAIGSRARVSLHKVRTMHTSTGLTYVVVQGGNGDAISTHRSVYALPITNNMSLPIVHGLLASKNANPYNHFKSDSKDFCEKRSFVMPAIVEKDMYTSADLTAKVGGQDILWGDITDMWVIGDAIFVAVGIPDKGQLPGIAYSRALFGPDAQIIGWTQWQRACGSTDNIHRAVVSSLTGVSLMLSGTNNETLTVLKETSFNQGAAEGLRGLVELVDEYFPASSGGVLQVRDFPEITPGLSSISLVTCVGKNTVMAVQTGKKQDSTVYPVCGADNFTECLCENATLPIDMPHEDTHVLVFRNGALSEIGPVTTTEIATDGMQGWLCAGGVGGIALLMHENGAGWPLDSGLKDGFAGLSTGDAFKKVGSYTFVRALTADDSFLYVLTNDRLDRIDLKKSNFATGKLAAVTLASIKGSSLFNRIGCFTDFVVSEKCAWLGTSYGMFRVGDGCTIQGASSESEVNWTPVLLDECCRGIRMFEVISVSGRIQDVARTGGMLYVLTSYRGKATSQVYRFGISSVLNKSNDASTMYTIGDSFIKGHPSYFVDLNDYRDWIFSDGAFFLHAENGRGDQTPIVRVLSPRMSSGNRFAVASSLNLPLGLPACTSIVPMTRSSAHGVWLMAGDFGLRTNE